MAAAAVQEDKFIKEEGAAWLLLPLFLLEKNQSIIMAKAIGKGTATSGKSRGSRATGSEASGDTQHSEMSQSSGNEQGQKPLEQFFLEALKDMYGAEKALTEALPRMQEAATTPELQEAFEDHTLLTQKHVLRLEKVFKLMGQQAEEGPCEAMHALIQEGERMMQTTPEGSMTRDAALIIGAQKIEHLEIAAYGGLAQLAITLGEDDVADILERTLNEEEETDINLTDIAESHINFEAEEETAE